MAQAGEDYSIETMLLASIADATRMILHGLFAKKGSKMPPSFVEAMREKPKVKQELSFKSGADFEAARERILKRYDNG